MNSTVNLDGGVLDFTSPVVRTRSVFPRTGYDSGAPDSFWFTDETPVTKLPTQEPVIVRNGVYDLPHDVLDNLEFYYSFNNEDSEFVGNLETPTPSPSATETPTPSPSPSPSTTETHSPTPTDD